MSGVGLARQSLNVTEDYKDPVTYVSVGVVDEGARWRDKLETDLRINLAQAGYPQPNEVIEEIRAPSPDPWRVVAPGVTVRASEYAVRYAHLDLEALRDRLSPEVFRAFVRHAGAIRGPEDVDVTLLVNEETR